MTKKTKNPVRKSENNTSKSPLQITEPTPQQQPALSEDVLCSIISRLTLREAVKTSVLSRGWRHLWTGLPVFRFDATIFDSRTRGELFKKSSPLGPKHKYELMGRMREQFVDTVNSVLRKHRGDRVEELRVAFFLHKEQSLHLDAWVEFAVAAKVRKLCFNLDQPMPDLTIELYDFPSHLLGSSCVEELYVTHCCLKADQGFDGFNHITKLHLNRVVIGEEDISRLLSNCSNLERLCLLNVGRRETLTISQSLGQLQSLVVQDCDSLRNIEIKAANLTRINYRGEPASIIFGRSAQLEHADICFRTDGGVRNLDFYLAKLHKNLPHLQSLAFYISGRCKVLDARKSSYTFMLLTRLDWVWNVRIKMTLLHLATLMDASPSLEELKLHFPNRVEEQPPQNFAKLRDMLPEQPHTHLKILEIRDFYCDKWQVEKALYLLKNAIGLESMTIQMGPMENSEVYIDNLSQEVPPKAKLVIL